MKDETRTAMAAALDDALRKQDERRAEDAYLFDELGDALSRIAQPPHPHTEGAPQ